ncbi:unnamed protein product [Periconia digitata]|uniref:NACHT domain-containing protein n=1 Tax=Periconia digitata TaxID=1303443 RepID=A0A9W4XKK5_9PLEO|nr:unnamed protein product [Periconia digitata]
MAGIRTALAIPTEPWEAAKARFLHDLTPSEIQTFNDATLENLFYDASTTQKKHATDSRTQIVLERITSFVDGIEDYGKALDVFANTSSMILCPLWGAIRVIIHIAGEAGKFQEKLMDMLAQIGDVIPRFRIYQVLYRKHERLLSALTEAYLDVLKFCTMAKAYFKRAKKSRLPLAIVLQGCWKPFRLDFENTMTKFRQHKKTVEKEAYLSHQIEAARSREIELAQRMQDDRRRRRYTVLSALRAVDYEAKHAKLLSAKHPGTNEWIHSNACYDDWIKSSKSTCLPCYGIPGSGKSVLAASVIDSLAGDFPVIMQLPLEKIGDNLNCPFKGNSPPPSSTVSRAFLTRIFREFKTAYIVIDGIDELSSNSQRHTLELIADLLSASHSTIAKIFVTSRSQEHPVRNALKDYKCLDLSTVDVGGDISTFIVGEMDILMKQNSLLESDSIRQEVLRALTAGAEGMFLWAKFLLYEIGEALSENDIRQALDNLPKNLSEVYSRIILKTHNKGGVQRIIFLRKVFMWLVCAQRPLHIEELREAVALEKTDAYLHTDRIASGSGDRLVGACENLVTLHEDGTVHFTHHTVKQFLCAESTKTSLVGENFIYVNFDEANHELGEICLAYLSFSDFETKVATIPAPLKLPPGFSEKLIWRGVPLGKHIASLISKRHSTTSSAEALNLASVNFPVPCESNSSQILTAQYILLEYMILFWPFHSAGFTPQHSSCWSVFREFVLEQKRPFNFRPWTQLTSKDKKENQFESVLDSGGNEIKVFNGDTWLIPTTWKEEFGLYTWSLKHGYKSLLHLSDTKLRGSYFQETHYSSFAQDYFNTLLGYPDKTEEYVALNFWSPFNIACNDHAYYAGGLERIRFLADEHRRWVDPKGGVFKLLVMEAIIIFLSSHRAVHREFWTSQFVRYFQLYLGDFEEIYDAMQNIGLSPEMYVLQ